MIATVATRKARADESTQSRGNLVNPKLSQAMVNGLVYLAYEAMGLDYWHLPHPNANTRVALITRELCTAGRKNDITDAGRVALLDALNGGVFEVPDNAALREYLTTDDQAVPPKPVSMARLGMDTVDVLGFTADDQVIIRRLGEDTEETVSADELTATGTQEAARKALVLGMETANREYEHAHRSAQQRVARARAAGAIESLAQVSAQVHVSIASLANICQWLATCTRSAVTVRHHESLGEVWVCPECALTDEPPSDPDQMTMRATFEAEVSE